MWKDNYSGKNFEHRRQWIVDRIIQLSLVFALDVCVYSDMSNHYWMKTALLTCMAYVDLNPIRAGMCKTPESSTFTSIRERILNFQQAQTKKTKRHTANIINALDAYSDRSQTASVARLLPFPFVGT